MVDSTLLWSCWGKYILLRQFLLIAYSSSKTYIHINPSLLASSPRQEFIGVRVLQGRRLPVCLAIALRQVSTVKFGLLISLEPAWHIHTKLVESIASGPGFQYDQSENRRSCSDDKNPSFDSTSFAVSHTIYLQGRTRLSDMRGEISTARIRHSVVCLELRGYSPSFSDLAPGVPIAQVFPQEYGVRVCISPKICRVGCPKSHAKRYRMWDGRFSHI